MLSRTRAPVNSSAVYNSERRAVAFRSASGVTGVISRPPTLTHSPARIAGEISVALRSSAPCDNVVSLSCVTRCRSTARFADGTVAMPAVLWIRCQQQIEWELNQLSMGDDVEAFCGVRKGRRPHERVILLDESTGC